MGTRTPGLLHAIRNRPIAYRSHMLLYQHLRSPDVARRRLLSPVVCSPLAPRSRDLELLIAEVSDQLQRPAQRRNEPVEYILCRHIPALDLRHPGY
jgi:hypothetical protein